MSKKEEENLNMELFNDEPFVDITGDDTLDFLFNEEQTTEETEETEETSEETIDDNTITNEEDEDLSESVVGDDNEDEAEEELESDDADTSSSNPNLFNSIAALLDEKGLISSAESDITNEDEFVEKFKSEIDTQVKSYLVSKLGEKGYEAIEKGVPLEKVNSDIEYLNSLSQLTEEQLVKDQNLRQRVIYQDLVNRGFSDAKAKKYLQRSIELEQDLEDSIEAIEAIKEFDKERIERENAEIEKRNLQLKQQEEERINNIKKTIKESNEVIKGFKITDSIKEKIEANMFKVVGENPVTKQPENALLKYRRENPIDFDHKLYYLYTITNGFQNFDSLVKGTKSTALKDLEKAMKSNTRIKDPGSPAYLQDPESYSIDISGHEIVVE